MSASDRSDGPAGAGAPRAEAPQIHTAGVITAGMGAGLERCLDSLAARAREAGRVLTIVVADDARDHDDQLRCRALLSSRGRALGFVARYAGTEQKRRFAVLLARESGVDPALVRAALGTWERRPAVTTAGANRNALSLDVAGEACLHSDDDVVWSPLRAPFTSDGVASSTAYAPWRMRFTPDRDAARADFVTDDGDLFAAHERLLGAAAPAGSARVRVTHHGALGDSGWGGLNVPTLSLLMPRALAAAQPAWLLHRAMSRWVARATVTTGTWCQLLAAGLDHREILPPFMPAGRNQDGLFAHVLRAGTPGAAFGYLPSAVLHEPPARTFEADELLRGALRLRLADVMMFLVGAGGPPPGVDAAGGLRAVGARLRGAAEGDDTDFTRAVADRVAHWRKQLIEGAEAGPARPGALPPPWTRALRAALDALRSSLEDRALLAIPDELREGRSAGEAVADLRAAILEYAALLEAWPTLLAAAKALRARGERLSDPV